MIEIQFYYKYTDKELNELLSSLVILVDSREKQNQHITQYFDSKKFSYESTKLITGDYGVKLPACPELGLARDVFFPVSIERKSSLDELAATFKERARVEHELVRARNLKFLLLIEDPDGYKNLVSGKYRSEYNPRALLGSLKGFEAKYGFGTAFVDKQLTGHFVFYHLYYHARNFLKGI